MLPVTSLPAVSSGPRKACTLSAVLISNSREAVNSSQSQLVLEKLLPVKVPLGKCHWSCLSKLLVTFWLFQFCSLALLKFQLLLLQCFLQQLSLNANHQKEAEDMQEMSQEFSQILGKYNGDQRLPRCPQTHSEFTEFWLCASQLLLHLHAQT